MSDTESVASNDAKEEPRRRASLHEVSKQCIPEEELKRIFQQFDFDGSGSIDERELHQAMKMLGCSCSMNTARKVLKQIDENSNGLVEWEEFQAFFGKIGDPEDIKNMLSSQCQRFFEYKEAVLKDPTFSKTFKVPKSVPLTMRFDGHNEAIESVVWRGDDEILSGSIDGEVLMWNAADEAKRPKPKRRLNVGQGIAMYSMTLSRDQRNLMVGLDKRKENPCLALWNLETESRTIDYEGHDSAVYACALNFDGAICASGGKSGLMCLHSTSAPAHQQAVQVHLGVIHSIDFCGDTSMFCSASKDGTVKVFDVRNELKAERQEVIIEDAAASGAVMQARWRNSFELLSAGEDFCVKRWDIRNVSKGPLTSYFGQTSVIRCLTISEDGQYMASGTHSGSVRIWAVDELGTLKEDAEQMEAEYERCRWEALQMQDNFETGTISLEDVRASTAAREAAKEKLDLITDRVSFLQQQGHQQAAFGCDGIKLPASALAWRAGRNGNLDRLASGAQDQAIRVFTFDAREIIPRVL